MSEIKVCEVPEEGFVEMSGVGNVFLVGLPDKSARTVSRALHQLAQVIAKSDLPSQRAPAAMRMTVDRRYRKHADRIRRALEGAVLVPVELRWEEEVNRVPYECLSALGKVFQRCRRWQYTRGPHSAPFDPNRALREAREAFPEMKMIRVTSPCGARFHFYTTPGRYQHIPTWSQVGTFQVEVIL